MISTRVLYLLLILLGIFTKVISLLIIIGWYIVNTTANILIQNLESSDIMIWSNMY
jgi:hypothetical protein